MADLLAMWNMSREGFRQLYDQVPGGKPSFEEAFRLTGGNPSLLARLYRESWDTNLVARKLVEEKRVTPGFVAKWRNYLKDIIDDPDALWRPDVPEELINELTRRNLILYFMPDRDARLWIDEPPPEKDPELGIVGTWLGKHRYIGRLSGLFLRVPGSEEGYTRLRQH